MQHNASVADSAPHHTSQNAGFSERSGVPSMTLGSIHAIRPDNAKELLQQLNNGMQGLSHLQKWKENADPNLQMQAMQSLAAIR